VLFEPRVQLLRCCLCWAVVETLNCNRKNSNKKWRAAAANRDVVGYLSNKERTTVCNREKEAAACLCERMLVLMCLSVVVVLLN